MTITFNLQEAELCAKCKNHDDTRKCSHCQNNPFHFKRVKNFFEEFDYREDIL
jgi:hypothetical protein